MTECFGQSGKPKIAAHNPSVSRGSFIQIAKRIGTYWKRILKEKCFFAIIDTRRVKESHVGESWRELGRDEMSWQWLGIKLSTSSHWNPMAKHREIHGEIQRETCRKTHWETHRELQRHIETHWKMQKMFQTRTSLRYLADLIDACSTF